MKKALLFPAITLALCALIGCTAAPAATTPPAPTPVETASASTPSVESSAPEFATPAPSRAPSRPEQAELSFMVEGMEEIVAVTLAQGDFSASGGPRFSLYIDPETYAFAQTNETLYHITATGDPTGITMLEIGLHAGADQDAAIAALFEGYAEISDEGATELGEYAARHVRSGEDGLSYNAYLIDVPGGVISVSTMTTIEAAEGHGARLRTMAGTLLIE